MKTILMLLISTGAFASIPKLTVTIKPVFTNISFESDIRPIFKARCTKCHDNTNKLPNVTDYGVAYALRSEIKKRVVESRTMPLYGNISESERTKVKNWIDGGASK